MRQCHQCHRPNPDEATFCHYDGIPLQAGAGGGSSGSIDFSKWAFPLPFVFPGGEQCHNFLQLAIAFHRNRDQAKQVLQQGFLESFFGSVGRVDLAMVAKTAAQATNADRGLDDVLGNLPGSPLEPAKLEVEPTFHQLGIVPAGESRQFTLQLRNVGDRLLYGKVSIDNVVWLGLGDNATPEKVFQFVDSTTLSVTVRGDNLRAFEKPQRGEITVESNGGTQTVVVEVTVPVKPFAEGVLSGAMSPRQLASKAKAKPKEAAELLERGAVAAWYKANGWEYPVKGPSATGLAAVQQFFEVLGLVKTPKVELTEPEVTLRGQPGDHLEYALKLVTPDKRAVYAHAVSDQPWLEVGKPIFRGTSATIPLRVKSAPGQNASAKLDIVANGGQKFHVPVTVEVGVSTPTSAPVEVVPAALENASPFDFGDAPPPPMPTPATPTTTESATPTTTESATPPTAESAPVAAIVPDSSATGGAVVVPAPAQAEQPSKSRAGLWLRLLPVAIVFVGLVTVITRDLVFAEPGEEPLPEIDYANPVLDLRFHDHLLANDYVPFPSMRFGLGIPNPDNPKKFKTKLIFDEFGRTCNVIVRVAAKEYMWGKEGGQWVPPMFEPLGELNGNKLIGGKSTWNVAGDRVAVTQIVEIVPGGLSEDGKKRLLDTCLIRYDLTNNDDVPHQVGLRFLLDTFIGGNDGVPFTVAGSSKLCNTKLSFDSPEEVPDFISALERQDLQNPGTVAHLSLKYGPPLEPPTRVTLGAWPDGKLRTEPGGRAAMMQDTRWSVPLLDMSLTKSEENKKGDSAVTLYWDDKQLAPKKTRSVGFAYGLGNVTGAKGDGQLLVSTGGMPVAEQEFTLTAHIKNPAPGTTATLKLPDRISLVSGSETVSVPSLPSGAPSPVSPVIWRVKASRGGVYRVRVSLSTGVEVVHRIAVENVKLFD